MSVEIQKIAAGHGWKWIAEGFGLFKKGPVMWIVMFIAYLIIAMILSMIPMLGPILMNVLAPVFVAGFMVGCRALSQDEDMEIQHFFAGFKHNTAQLITVGGLYLVGIIVIVGIMFAGVDHNLMSAAMSGAPISDEQALALRESGFLSYALVGMVLLLLLCAAYWFAPVLVMFNNVSAIEAMKLSFSASMRNFGAFAVYGLIAATLLILAAIPFALGLLVMIPTMTASLYTSYKDIFIER